MHFSFWSLQPVPRIHSLPSRDRWPNLQNEWFPPARSLCGRPVLIGIPGAFPGSCHRLLTQKVKQPGEQLMFLAVHRTSVERDWAIKSLLPVGYHFWFSLFTSSTQIEWLLVRGAPCHRAVLWSSLSPGCVYFWGAVLPGMAGICRGCCPLT